ncbi:MAG: hypothetical protein Q9198_001835 [Flavoplaca austrocitrina]
MPREPTEKEIDNLRSIGNEDNIYFKCVNEDCSYLKRWKDGAHAAAPFWKGDKNPRRNCNCKVSKNHHGKWVCVSCQSSSRVQIADVDMEQCHCDHLMEKKPGAAGRSRRLPPPPPSESDSDKMSGFLSRASSTDPDSVSGRSSSRGSSPGPDSSRALFLTAPLDDLPQGSPIEWPSSRANSSDDDLFAASTALQQKREDTPDPDSKTKEEWKEFL